MCSRYLSSVSGDDHVIDLEGFLEGGLLEGLLGVLLEGLLEGLPT